MSLLVDRISKTYATRAEPLEVLREISFELAPGENLAVLGPSGSGKSTLLSILGTLEPPTAGRVLIDETDPAALDEPALARLRNRRIGFVFQEHFLLPQCTVVENVLVPTLAGDCDRSDMLRRAGELLDRVGLAERRDHRPAELSGGERQRAALARALIRRPHVVLADEPTGNLDRATGERIGRLLLDLQQQEQTVLIVATHSRELADMLSRRIDLAG